MRIRRFQSSDAAPCAALFFRAVHEGAARKYTSEQRQAWLPKVPDTESFAKRLGSARTFVAEQDGIVGFMSVTPDGYLDLAYVEPELMGSGLAGALYDGIERLARDDGLGKISTHASLLAEPFFAKRGWEVVAAEEVERNGVLIPRFHMVKVLTD